MTNTCNTTQDDVESEEQELAMPDKKLMYEVSVIDFEVDENNLPEEVVLLERWGKSNRKARTRTLPKDKRGCPEGGKVYTTRGVVVIDGQVYEVQELNNNSNWWLRPIDWGEPKETRRQKMKGETKNE